MNGNVALDTSVAVRFLNGDQPVVAQVLALTTVILPTNVIATIGKANFILNQMLLKTEQCPAQGVIQKDFR